MLQLETREIRKKVGHEEIIVFRLSFDFDNFIFIKLSKKTIKLNHRFFVV